MSQLFQSCRDLIQEKNASVRTVSQIIGKLALSVKAVLPAPLHYRHLTPTRLQVKGSLMGKGNETVLPLSEDCRKDLQGGSIKCPHGMVAQ